MIVVFTLDLVLLGWSIVSALLFFFQMMRISASIGALLFEYQRGGLMSDNCRCLVFGLGFGLMCFGGVVFVLQLECMLGALCWR